MKKIYIAGKVTGEPQQEVIIKFACLQVDLEKLGFEVINPLEVVRDWDTPWNMAMKLCLHALIDCDGAILLDDWMRSKGAKIEVEICDQLGIPTFNNIDDLKLWNN